MSHRDLGLLNTEQRRGIRSIGVAAMQRANGDEDKAKQYAREMVREQYGSILGAIVLQIAIWLVVELIKWWIMKGINAPEMEYQPDEPGYSV